MSGDMEAASEDLILNGTITAITPANLGHAGRFVVRLEVASVEQGTFLGETFDFAVHSPEKSGLRLGSRCRLHARMAPGGWQVDPWQWRPQLPD